MIHFIGHGVNLRDAKGLLSERLHQTVLVLLVDLDDSVGVLNGNTHLKKVLREGLFRHKMLACLREDEFNQR